MRIISGSLKGRRFSPPKNFIARPTTDIAKESLFNVLSNRINFEAISALDMFGGTGSISFELASRGCTDITCIEMNPKHFGFIKSTAIEFKVNDHMKLLRADSLRYIKKCDRQFDFVFADPPFSLSNLEEIPELFFNQDLLTKNGFFVLEHSDKISFEKHPNFVEVRKYGKVNFSFFEKT